MKYAGSGKLATSCEFCFLHFSSVLESKINSKEFRTFLKAFWLRLKRNFEVKTGKQRSFGTTSKLQVSTKVTKHFVVVANFIANLRFEFQLPSILHVYFNNFYSLGTQIKFFSEV